MQIILFNTFLIYIFETVVWKSSELKRHKSNNAKHEDKGSEVTPIVEESEDEIYCRPLGEGIQIDPNDEALSKEEVKEEGDQNKKENKHKTKDDQIKQKLAENEEIKNNNDEEEKKANSEHDSKFENNAERKENSNSDKC